MIQDANTYESPPPSRIVSKILGSRQRLLIGERYIVSEASAKYIAYTVTDGFPQMGFTLGVYRRSKENVTVESHGILFHDLKKPKWRTFENSEYITFTHSGEAYTLRGKGLYEMYLGLLNNTLQSALEFEPSVFEPVEHGRPLIDRIAVTDVAEMVRRSREERSKRNDPTA